MGGAPAQVNNDDVIEVPVGNHDTVADWLLSLGLQHYLNLMVTNGFDDIHFLVMSIFYFLFICSSFI